MLTQIIDMIMQLLGMIKKKPELLVSDASDMEDSDEVVIEEPDEIDQPELQPDEPKPIHKPRYLWCLDNGHGSKQPGKRSPKLEDGRQLLEWKWNREVVNRIAKQLEILGVEFYIVVEEDDVDDFLKERVERANNIISDLPKIFVSVHSNAVPAPEGRWCDPSISGIETWYYYGSNEGKIIASVFQKHLIAATGWKNRFIKSRPEDQFYVLRNTNMTAILTENGFYNNKAQCLELLKEETKDKIASAHVDAILEIERI